MMARIAAEAGLHQSNTKKTIDCPKTKIHSTFVPMQSTALKNCLHLGFLKFLLAASLASIGVQAEAKFPPGRWNEEALLHDGRVVEVDREVFETGGGLCFLCLGERRYSSFNRHSLRFVSPDTQSSIEWTGEEGFIPVLLDFVNRVPYLVVQGRPTQESAKRYGCPELPFIYLKYESGFWRPISVDDVPANLRNANLATDVREIREGNLTHQEVLRNIANHRHSSGEYFQTQIPRTYEEWKYSGKDGARNDRRAGDCRPPPSGPQEVVLPPPIDVELQLVESNDFDDSTHAESLLRWQPTPQSQRNCFSVFKVADPSNRMAGQRFTNDPTGSKPVPYIGKAPVREKSGEVAHVRAFEYCDTNFVWFVAEKEEVGKIYVTKYTLQGDIVYNARFARPQTVPNHLYGRILVDLVKVEEGNFTFYWRDSLPAPPNQSKLWPARITKFRFSEPQQSLVSN